MKTFDSIHPRTPSEDDEESKKMQDANTEAITKFHAHRCHNLLAAHRQEMEGVSIIRTPTDQLSQFLRCLALVNPHAISGATESRLCGHPI